MRHTALFLILNILSFLSFSSCYDENEEKDPYYKATIIFDGETYSCEQSGHVDNFVWYSPLIPSDYFFTLKSNDGRCTLTFTTTEDWNVKNAHSVKIVRDGYLYDSSLNSLKVTFTNRSYTKEDDGLFHITGTFSGSIKDGANTLPITGSFEGSRDVDEAE